VHADCIANHVPTGLEKGAHRREGSFYRCLKSGEVVRRYAKDSAAEFGFRVRPDKWRWQEDENDQGLSVSCSVCSASVNCAIHLHPKPSLFVHVVEIDVAALSDAIEIPLVAQFDPVEESPQNPCHFLLLPTDRLVEDVRMALSEFMAEDFPSGQKPNDAESAAQAREAQVRYERVFRIHRDVA
jgi:hypothetical protein